MTTAAQYAQLGALEGLSDGEWVRDAGGVMRWRETKSDGSAAAAAAREELARSQLRVGRIDVHQLRACTTCPARVDEPCVHANGTRSSQPHEGRLAPRLCRCGELPAATSRQCSTCASACATTAKARSIRNAVRRERAA